MQILSESHKNRQYVYFIMIWISVLSLVSVSVIMSGIDLGKYSLLFYFIISLIQVYVIMYNFMNIKKGNPLLKIFYSVSVLFVLLILFFSTH